MDKSDGSNLTFSGLMYDCILNERDKGRLAGEMLRLAAACANVEAFLKECNNTEAYWKSPERKEDQITGSLPSAWTQAKSDIKSGWLMKLEPKEFETMSLFRQAKTAANAGRPTTFFRKGGGGKAAADAAERAEAEAAKTEAKVEGPAPAPEAPAAPTTAADEKVDPAMAAVVLSLAQAIKLIGRLPDTERKRVTRDVIALVQSQHDTYFKNLKKGDKTGDQKSEQKAA
jgi:hypothetical protein